MTVYCQVRHFSFVNFDDHLYVEDNKHVLQAGLTLDSIIWACTDGTKVTNYFAPVTLISFIFDYKRYGMNAGGYHMTNLFFHIVNTLLLFFVLRRMTGHIWRSGFVAALFALHPLHVESVAWVTERKDVLCAFFWMLTMWAYVWYAECPGVKRYLVVLLFFILGLMSKPMIVTLPFVLLLFDYWPLRRMAQRAKCIAKSGKLEETILRENGSNSLIPKFPNSLIPQSVNPTISVFIFLIIEKMPMFFIIVISSIAAFFTQQAEGAIKSLDEFSISVRIANSLVSYISYLFKTIWPLKLAFVYPHPGALPFWKVSGAFILFVTVSFFAIRNSIKRPWFTVGWLWYLGTLVPVIGLVVIGPHAMADRYTYIPLIGIFIIIAWSVPEWMHGLFNKKYQFLTISAAVFFALMLISWVQIRYWENSITLCEHALNVTESNYIAHNNLGIALFEKGEKEKAIHYYKIALGIKPDLIKTHNNLGAALSEKGELEAAIVHFKKALGDHPEYEDPHDTLLGEALEKIGRFEEAITLYQEMLRINPKHVGAHNNLGLILAAQGKKAEAINHYVKALRVKPDFVEAHNNLGIAFASQGRTNEAIKHYSIALQLKPDFLGAHNNLGVALANLGRLDEAIQHFRLADSQSNLKQILAYKQKINSDKTRKIKETLDIHSQ